ncbi:hypothetical protein B0H19DRAFT_1155734 [Mycena capillaripes]|nr:hypothetical protein B0H19DRAFT_1161212 [Mycena capillaripes]KAJ6553137.1 hypothetical protein B0H19DRAFT_1155734 [Mycena capillaripes]
MLDQSWWLSNYWGMLLNVLPLDQGPHNILQRHIRSELSLPLTVYALIKSLVLPPTQPKDIQKAMNSSNREAPLIGQKTAQSRA